MVGVILGHPRCGSTSLAHAVGAACNINVPIEPFHRPMRNAGISLDSSTFDSYFSETMTASVIKHMWNGVPQHLTEHVFAHSDLAGVVFIYREDTVGAALSAVVAKELGRWNITNEGTLDSPLPLEDIDKRVKLLSNGQRKYCTLLGEYHIPHLVVSYEAIYSSRVDDSNRRRLLTAICNVLGQPPNNVEAGLVYLAPNNRQKSRSFYRSAPNWDEFVQRFGRR